MKKIPSKIKLILQEIQNELKKIYSDRFKGLILFGSYGRGDFIKGSDIDILMLIEQMNNPFYERLKYFNIISELSLKYDTVISIVPYDFEEFHKKRTPLILNVNKEGIKL